VSALRRCRRPRLYVWSVGVYLSICVLLTREQGRERGEGVRGYDSDMVVTHIKRLKHADRLKAVARQSPFYRTIRRSTHAPATADDDQLRLARELLVLLTLLVAEVGANDGETFGPSRFRVDRERVERDVADVCVRVGERVVKEDGASDEAEAEHGGEDEVHAAAEHAHDEAPWAPRGRRRRRERRGRWQRCCSGVGGVRDNGSGSACDGGGGQALVGVEKGSGKARGHGRGRGRRERRGLGAAKVEAGRGGRIAEGESSRETGRSWAHTSPGEGEHGGEDGRELTGTVADRPGIVQGQSDVTTASTLFTRARRFRFASLPVSACFCQTLARACLGFSNHLSFPVICAARLDTTCAAFHAMQLDRAGYFLAGSVSSYPNVESSDVPLCVKRADARGCRVFRVTRTPLGAVHEIDVDDDPDDTKTEGLRDQVLVFKYKVKWPDVSQCGCTYRHSCTRERYLPSTRCVHPVSVTHGQVLISLSSAMSTRILPPLQWHGL
jgi:hypothetical protein